MKRQFSITAICLSSLFYVSGIVNFLEAAEKNSTVRAGRTRGLRTCFTGFDGSAISPDLRNKMRVTVENGLAKFRGCELVPPAGMKDEKGESTECVTRDCLKERGGRIGAERILYASVAEDRSTVRARKDKEGYGRYLVMEGERLRYIIIFELYDGVSGKSLAKVREVTGGGGMNRTLDKMVKQLARHFTPVVLEDGTAEEGSEGEFFSISLGYLGPLLRFGLLTESGIGADLGVGVENCFLPALQLSVSAGYGYYFTTEGSISSMNALQLMTRGGYVVDLYGPFCVTPSLGLGIITFFVEEHDGDHRTFTDALLRLSFPFAYRAESDYSIFLTPGFTIFFEKENAGILWSIGMGINYYIDIF